jgi:2-haloacid dehalogenase
VQLPDAITFDCYGTLIDWEGAVAAYLADLLQRVSRPTDAARRLQARWEEIQWQAIQGPYRRYRTILRESLAATLEEAEVPFGVEDLDRFADSMGHWPPFADTVAAIQHLQRHVRVVLVTNTDADIARATESALGLHFDDIVTAEAAGAYKPDPRPFALALERLGLPVGRVWHAGFGFRYDIVPARALGLFSVWVNRQRQEGPADCREDLMVGDLATLAWVVEGLAHA